MPSIKLNLSGDGSWPDLKFLVDANQIHGPELFTTDSPWEIALLPGGMKSGKHAVIVRLEIPRSDGTHFTVLAETSADCLLTAAVGIKARIEMETIRSN